MERATFYTCLPKVLVSREPLRLRADPFPGTLPVDHSKVTVTDQWVSRKERGQENCVCILATPRRGTRAPLLPTYARWRKPGWECLTCPGQQFQHSLANEPIQAKAHPVGIAHANVNSCLLSMIRILKPTDEYDHL